MKKPKQSKAIVNADPAKKLRRKSARTLQGETPVALLKELKLEPPCISVADLLEEMDAALTSAKMSEVDDLDFPEGTVAPDKETAGLIADVIAVADEFRPLHQKLKTVVEAHRTKIVLLKSKFGVRKGYAGHRVVVGDSAMMWEEFVTYYFGVTPHRLNQLLDVKDEKDSRTFVLPTPDEEKYLFKKGLAAGQRKNELAIVSLEEKLAALQATPEAHKLAERLVVLEAFIEGEIGKKVKYEETKPVPAANEPEPQDVTSNIHAEMEKEIRTAVGIPSDKPVQKQLVKAYDAGWRRGYMAAGDTERRNAVIKERNRKKRQAVERSAKNPEHAGGTSATSAIRTESNKKGEAKK